jgi:hypothetical protein
LRDPPGCSGSEVVGAATIPPVGAWISAFSVSSDRRTSAAWEPPTRPCAAQRAQNAAVSSSTRSAWRIPGGGAWLGA